MNLPPDSHQHMQDILSPGSTAGWAGRGGQGGGGYPNELRDGEVRADLKGSGGGFCTEV